MQLDHRPAALVPPRGGLLLGPVLAGRQRAHQLVLAKASRPRGEQAAHPRLA